MVRRTLTVSQGIIGTPLEAWPSPKWVFRNCNLAIEDGLITEITEKVISHGDYHIDASECVVLPTFTNAHTHGFEFAFKGFKDGRSVDDSHPKWFWHIYRNAPAELLELGTRIHLAECIVAGIGCVAEVLRYDIHEHEFQAALHESGMRGRIFSGSPGTEYSSGFDLVSESHPVFLERLEVARSLSIECPLHMHFLETEHRRKEILKHLGATTGLILKKKDLLHRVWLLTHCGAARSNDMDVFQGKKALVITTPSAEARLGEPCVNPLMVKKHNLSLGIGTDGPCYNPATDMFQEMRTALFMSAQKDPSWEPGEILYAATLSPRYWLGGTDRGIVEGAEADMQVISLSKSLFHPKVRAPYNNLLGLIIAAAHHSDIKATIVNGNVLCINGKPTRIDMTDLLRQMRSSLASFFSELKIGRLYEASL